MSSSQRLFTRSWSGEHVAVYEIEDEADILLLGEDGSLTPWLAMDFAESEPELSPDARWIAYVSDETDRMEVYVRPLTGTGSKVPISIEGGRDPIWSPDGRELFYRSGRSVMSVALELDPSFRPHRPRELFTGPYASSVDTASAAQSWYDISPDGEHFVMIETSGARADVELHVILNWHRELERLVPMGE